MYMNDWITIRYGLRHAGYRLVESSARRIAVAQRGAILPLVATGMLAVVTVAGLALDMGHGYLNKTRLQNALDAAALSGAKTLDETTDTGMATTAAQTAFGENAKNDAGGNKELFQNIAPGNVTVEFSETLNPFTPGGANPRFVRAGVSAANFATDSWLLQAIGVANVNVGARAVAGPSPALVCPEIVPIAPCGTPGAVNYGYAVGQEVQLKFDANNKGPIGNGNFGNVDVGCGPGGSCIRDSMAGAYEGCAKLGDTIPTKPGNNVGPNAQGLNSRFNCPPPGCGPVDTSTYKPDVVIDAGGSGYPDTYSQYMTDRATSNWDLSPPTAQSDPPRRLVAVPVVDCSTAVSGSGDLPLLGVACMFLTRPAEHAGNTQTIFAEFRSSGCIGYGSAPGPNPVIGPGPHTIILYKDFGVADS
jgi:Flp pilus assembly protein TadG